MASFTLEREVAPPPEVVFDGLTDNRGCADITPVRRVELERTGSTVPLLGAGVAAASQRRAPAGS